MTWAEVTTAFPNDATLAAVDDDEAAIYIGWVDNEVDDAIIGDRSDELRILLAAHLAMVAAGGGSGAGGPVASESVDGVSRSYAVPTSTDDADLSATSYGRRARALMMTSPRARLPRAY